MFARESNLASSHYKYIAVFDKEAKSQKMESAMSLEKFRKIIKKSWGEGYDIGEIKYGNGKWMCIFTKTKARNKQGYETSETVEALQKVLTERQRKGFDIIDLSEGW